METKIKLYVAKTSKDIVAAKAWLEKAQAAGFDVYHWTSDPGWANPTEANRISGAVADLVEVHKAHVLWWQLDDHPSEGAAVEFGYALAQRLANPKSKILIVVSGARAIDDRAFFSLHPAVDMRFATHEEAWLYINLIKDATESVVGLIKNAAQGP